MFLFDIIYTFDFIEFFIKVIPSKPARLNSRYPYRHLL